jgi:hypothetical protein
MKWNKNEDNNYILKVGQMWFFIACNASYFCSSDPKCNGQCWQRNHEDRLHYAKEEIKRYLKEKELK